MRLQNIVLAASVLGLAFYGGYLAGYSSADATKTPSKNELNSKHYQDPNQSAQSQPSHAWADIEARLRQSAGATKTSDLTTSSSQGDNSNNLSDAAKNAQGNDDKSDEFAWQDPNDVVAMFNELIRLSEPGNENDVSVFSQAIDQLRTTLADSPTQLAILVEHMQSLDFESREFHYVTAILQGLPNQKGIEALEQAALQASQRFDSASRQQFLHLVANTHNAADNPEILDSLVDIALYSEENASTKLDALDLVMPFQLDSVEREQILSGLNGMLDNADVTDKNAVVSHVLRFSNAEQRSNIASQYIDSSNSDELRYSILDGLHSGTVPRTSNIKEQLLFIAQDPQDPMREQAKHALMYVFDISNQEYQQIKD